MINTIFHFIDDPTFDYAAAIENGDISEYTIVLNSADHSIYCKGTTFGRMERSDIADLLGDMSGILPVATEDKIGGVKIGYTSNTDANNRKYAVKLDTNKRAYVEVPWSDTITPAFDDSQLRQTINDERERVDALIQNIGNIVDQKNRQLYADGDWIREIFGNVQDPGSMAAAQRKELDDYLQAFDVWEYIDPEHPELGRRARISELQNTADGLTHRMGEAEVGLSGTQVKVSTLKHDLDGLTSTVTDISDDLDTVTKKESAFEQTVDSIGLRVTASEGNISNLQTQEASLQIQADKIQSRVVATENSINGCYKVTIVQSPSNAASAVDVSTISEAVEAKGSLSNNQLINDEDFTTAPTDGTLYKNSVPQYFTFNRYQGLTVRASSLEQTADSITARVGTVEGSLNDPTTGLITRTSTLEQTADSISTRVGAVETKADKTETALSSFEQTVNTEISGIKTAHTELSSSVSSYETTNDGNIGNLIKMAAAVLDLKSSSDEEGNLSTTTDLANVITSEGFTGYSGLSQRVSQTEDGVSANASLIADVQDAIEDLDIDGAVTRATAGFATETWVGQHYDTIGSAATAESNAKGYADDIVAGAKADVIASIDDTVAGMTVLVTKDSSGYIDSNIYLKANQIYLDGQTNFKNAVGAFLKTDVLEAGVADIKARLTVGGSDPSGSGTPGTITMKNASDGTIGIWDKDKFAVSTTSSPSSSNSAMLINADGSGSAAKGNISWNANGDVTIKGTLDGCDGTFSGSLSAVSLSGMTITGDQIEGGSIVVGGSGNATNGSIVVKDANDTELGRLDKTGISASQGTIGGFTIGTDKLSNTNYNASISIKNANSTQISNIGKDAVDAMTNQSCSLEAQSKGTGTYNTALYLNAEGATYNYAFHGNGNGVLNGLIFGFKTKVYTVSGSTDSTTDMSITDGATFVFKGSKTNGWAYFKVPTLNNVKQALGLPTSSTTPFAIEVNFINHSNYDYVMLYFYDSGRTTLPKWYSYNFDGTAGEMQLAKGDFAKFLLTYDGSEYRANRICHFDSGF